MIATAARRALLAVVLVCSIAHANSFPALTVTVTPVQVSNHAYYVQGLPGVASAANEGFNSNAGFVVTGDGVVVFACDAVAGEPLARELDATSPVVPWPHATRNNTISAPAAAGLTSSRTHVPASGYEASPNRR